jgi:hypothetical protein
VAARLDRALAALRNAGIRAERIVRRFCEDVPPGFYEQMGCAVLYRRRRSAGLELAS